MSIEARNLKKTITFQFRYGCSQKELLGFLDPSKKSIMNYYGPVRMWYPSSQF